MRGWLWGLGVGVLVVAALPLRAQQQDHADVDAETPAGSALPQPPPLSAAASAPASQAADPVGSASAPLPDPQPEPPASLPAPTEPDNADLPPSDNPAFLTSLGDGAGPGIPWQVVLLAQLVAFAAADLPAYVGCVVGSWVLSLVVPVGGLPLAVVVSLALIPAAAIVSGLGSAALLQWLGDRLGTRRGRLALVALTSMSLSFATYALVIFPIVVGMGFFSAAAYATASASALLVLPAFNLPAPPWWLSAAGYSASAVGLVAALVVVAVGALLAPLLGFVLRPPLVALVYRLTSRAREPGEEQWPPSLFGERADKLPWPFRSNNNASAAPPSAPPPPPEAAPDAQPQAASQPSSQPVVQTQPASLPAAP